MSRLLFMHMPNQGRGDIPVPAVLIATICMSDGLDLHSGPELRRLLAPLALFLEHDLGSVVAACAPNAAAGGCATA